MQQTGRKQTFGLLMAGDAGERTGEQATMHARIPEGIHIDQGRWDLFEGAHRTGRQRKIAQRAGADHVHRLSDIVERLGQTVVGAIYQAQQTGR